MIFSFKVNFSYIIKKGQYLPTIKNALTTLKLIPHTIVFDNIA